MVSVHSSIFRYLNVKTLAMISKADFMKARRAAAAQLILAIFTTFCALEVYL